MRCSGILMHITSLPGAYGIGSMGARAYEFIDFLKKAGQSCWQILPLNPTGYGNSPYQSCSTFAGNHYLIDLDMLVKDGLLLEQEIKNIQWCDSDTRADFGRLYNNRLKVLHLAYTRFRGGEAFDAFCRENSQWLPDFSLFMALKTSFGGKPWYDWDEDLKYRRTEAIESKRSELCEQIRFYSFVQFLFFTQWNALRAYAHENGIQIIGDVPIYVPLDSVDVWVDTRLFQLDETLTPVAVAGCPPDAFTQDGQLWGNPLYRWDVMKKEDFAWWIRRLSAAGQLYDVVRMDHFRGLEAYWSVPYGDATARNGKWIKGPGMEFISAIKDALPGLKMIAEDLGYLTQEVLDLRDNSGYPGMKVLGFAFDSREPSAYLPHNYIRNTVCYTGTHDNMTTRQWLETAPEDAVEYAAAYMNLSEAEGLAWGVVRTAFASVSDMCIVPMQDILDLGGEARMNFPGTLSDSNWTWRVKDGIINDALAARILTMTKLYCRTCGDRDLDRNCGDPL